MVEMVISSYSSKQLMSQLIVHSQRQFTGKLEVDISTGGSWKIYMNLGRLVWAMGSVHPYRRWLRLLKQQATEISIRDNVPLQANEIEFWEYQILTKLTKQRQVTIEQVVAVIEGTLKEILLEICQAVDASLNQQDNTFQIQAQNGLRPSQQGLLPPPCMLNTKPLVNQVYQQWDNWCRSGLSYISPNWAPVIKEKTLLQKRTSPHVYQNLERLITGQLTLWDLAVVTNKDVLTLTRSLLPYIRQQLVELVKIKDLTPSTSQNSTRQVQVNQPLPSQVPSKKELIACIDDSPQVCAMMKEILQSKGYRFLGIQDGVQALPILLQHKPDLIFLDLVMPIANGYEICTQIRRISNFKTTPVIILSGHDGVVDRVRAKMVGATDFLSKPIEPKKVMAALHKYTKSPVDNAVTSNS